MASLDITAEVAELRTLILDEFRPDTFQLTRETSTSDNAGGLTSTTDVVASGVCRLRPAGGGNEQIIATRMGWQGAYAVDLDPSVSVLPSDDLIVNGRTMEIGGVARGGNWQVQQTIVCQERG